MNRSGKRPLTPDISHRSTKRRKSISTEHHPLYSKRAIPWKEQKDLPKRFHEHGQGFWPALRIRQERGSGNQREYLIEWEPHPRTHEIFEPTWTPAGHVNTPLLKEWKEGKRRKLLESEASSPSSVEAAYARNGKSRLGTNHRRFKNRRVIPDSSGEAAETYQRQQIAEASRTPTPSGSGSSQITGSNSLLEVSETQQPTWAYPLAIHVPPPPSDKAEYESLRGTQLSETHFNGSVNSLLGATVVSSPHTIRSCSIQTRSQFASPISHTRVREDKPLDSQNGIPTRRTQLPARALEYSPEEGKQSVLHTIEPIRAASTEPSYPSTPAANFSTNSFDRSAQQSSSRKDQQFAQPLPIQVLTQQSSDHDLNSIKPYDVLTNLNHSINRSNRRSQTELVPTSSSSSHESQRFQTQLPLSFYSSPLSQDIPGLSRVKGQAQSPLSTLDRTRTMAARATRQSPRLQVATPNLPSTSSKVPMRGNPSRSRSGGTVPEISSPLAATAPNIPESLSPEFSTDVSGQDVLHSMNTFDYQDSNSNIILPRSMHIDATGLSNNDTSQPLLGEPSFDATTNPIQESIEEEITSSNEDGSLESKASSSQRWLEKEQLVRQQDGLIMPDFPVLGQDEYCLALPAEGKVQAIYAQTIKVKRKAILRFIRRRGSVNLAGTSTNKTIERNTMLELIQRLHDTTTHIDLGLPGVPTQYTIPSSEHAAYADYAGSKFVFLGCLIDDLSRRDCTIAIMAQPTVQDLIEEYLIMKNVNVSRHDRPGKPPRNTQSETTSLRVELLCTKANEVVNLNRKPVLVIALDASFESLDPQVRHMQAQFQGPLPILHLMVTNSSEHVERCLPVSMPSPIRLKLLVRATYQAHANLGGPTTYVEDPSDVPVGRPMDMLEFSKAIRKSPRRKLAMLAAIVANTALSDDFAANWTLKSMPELVLDDLEDSPPSSKESRAASVIHRARSRTPVPHAVTNARGRSQTPIQAAGTPTSRKRLLELDAINDYSKRPRIASNEGSQVGDPEEARQKVDEMQRQLDTLKAELTVERVARLAAEEARALAEQKLLEWQSSLAQLQHRYEKRTKKSHLQSKENKKLLVALENGKARIEHLNTSNASLKAELSNAKASLTAAREDLKAAGGDIAAIELAREETRTATSKAAAVEKSMASSKRDFEFVRNQYQDASNRAAELANQVTELEKQNAVLSKQASDERRRLKEMSTTSGIAQHLAKIAQLEQEKKHRDILLKRQEDEMKLLKRNRGVQTRGSSVQPGSPGPRSRQGSPAAGYLGPPSGSRASVLRHER